jgi:general secretion pathway protein I
LKRRHQVGFTLIEILVALVIVAVGMGVLMSALTSSARTVVYLQDKTFAEWVALNQITLLRLQLQQGNLPPQRTTNGDLDYAGRSWHWRQEVIASSVPGLERIDFKVRPKEIKGGDDDSWYVTVSGVMGNAIGTPGLAFGLYSWDGGQTQPQAGGNNPGQPLTPNPGGNNPPQTPQQQPNPSSPIQQ